MNKILIIRTGAIGDVVHTTNLYRAIKSENPQVSIHYLTSEAIKPLLEVDKDLDKIISVPCHFNFFSNEMKNLIKILKQENYDYVINLQPSIKTRLLVLFVGVKKHAIYKKNLKIHAVKNFWQTGLKFFPNIKEIADLKLYLPNNIVNRAKESLKDLKRPIIIFSAGGMFSKRQGRAYEREKWIELGNKLAQNLDCSIILTGTKEDAEFLKPLEKIKNSINYIGKLSLVESCALISQSNLMISGDSGPLHVASALGIKCIGLYGAMPINRTGCYCNGINIVSKEIYAPCMKEIDIETIYKAVFTLYHL